MFQEEGALLPAQILAGQRRETQSPDEPRFCLSHFPSRRTSWKRSGPRVAPKLSCADAPLVNAIPSSAMDAGASRPTMNTRTGSASVAVAAPLAGRLSRFFRCFLSLTPTRFAGALSGIATALFGALLLGRGHAYAQRPESRSRFFHASPLGPQTGLLPTGSFVSSPNAHPRHSLADTRCSGGSPS